MKPPINDLTNGNSHDLVKGLTGAGSAFLAVAVSVQDDILFWLRVASLVAGTVVSLLMAWSILRKKKRGHR